MSKDKDEKQTTIVHPALDYTADNAFVGQMLPSSKPTANNQRTLHLIVDDRRVIECTEEALARFGIEIQSPDFPLPQRWSVAAINDFREGKEAVEPPKLFSIIRELFKTYIELHDDRLYDFHSMDHWNVLLSPLQRLPICLCWWNKREWKDKAADTFQLFELQLSIQREHQCSQHFQTAPKLQILTVCR